MDEKAKTTESSLSDIMEKEPRKVEVKKDPKPLKANPVSANFDSSNVKPINPMDILPKAEKHKAEKEYEDALMSALDDAVVETKTKIDENFKKVEKEVNEVNETIRKEREEETLKKQDEFAIDGANADEDAEIYINHNAAVITDNVTHHTLSFGDDDEMEENTTKTNVGRSKMKRIL